MVENLKWFTTPKESNVESETIFPLEIMIINFHLQLRNLIFSDLRKKHAQLSSGYLYHFIHDVLIEEVGSFAWRADLGSDSPKDESNN